MLVGPYVNGGATLIGAVAGAMLANQLPERLRTSLTPFFGIPSMVMAVVMIMKLSHLQVVVLSGIVGLIIGELIYLEKGIGKLASSTRGIVDRLLPAPKGELTQEQFLEKFVAITVLFCASGTGIFGAMHEGMSGDSSILVTKSILDFFTSMIFATALGYSVAVICMPQILIQLALAFSAVLIVPLTTPAMQADFSAVGGLLMLATGFRICGIKPFPVANLIPALVIAMPLSALWATYIG